MMALGIGRVQQQFKDACGWCYAESGIVSKHKPNHCPGVRHRCVRCWSGKCHDSVMTLCRLRLMCFVFADDHWASKCRLPYFSKMIGHYAKAKTPMCHFCGLPWRQGGCTFHAGSQTNFDEKFVCNSGLKDFAETYCWYLFHNRPDRLKPVLDGLKELVTPEKSLASHFQDCMAQPTGRPWAGAITIFMKTTGL